jgi:hypothetical protein
VSDGDKRLMPIVCWHVATMAMMVLPEQGSSSLRHYAPYATSPPQMLSVWKASFQYEKIAKIGLLLALVFFKLAPYSFERAEKGPRKCNLSFEIQ